MSSDFLQPLLDWIAQHQTWALLIVFFIAMSESLAIVGMFVPGAIMMVGTGALIATGTLAFWPVFGWAVAGAITGDGVSYWLGYHYKDQLRAMWPFSRYPDLLNRGEGFLDRHGGKSIFFGRFVGPVRAIIPATAGMMGMPPLRFFIANIISALAWAPAYLFPGIVFAASLSLAAEVATRLAALVFSIALLVLLGIWLIKRIYNFLAPRALNLTEQWGNWGRQHKYLGQVTAALVDPQHPELKGLAIVALTLISLAWLILSLFKQFSVGPPLARLDHSTYQLIQDLRTPWGDQVMVFVSQLGDGIVQTVLIAALAIWLIWQRHWLALFHWLAAAGFAAFATWTLKQGLQLPRPTELFDGTMRFSFPSAHTVLAMCLYGFLAVLIARALSPRWRWLPYAVAWSIILTIAFSRLYLGAHWLSDVAGGILLGLTWTLALGVAYRRHLGRAINPSGLITVPILVLATYGTWHVVETHDENMQLYTPHYELVRLDHSQWLNNDWQQLPSYRIDTRGIEKQPLNLQWAGRLETLQHHLGELGWQLTPPLSFSSAMHWLTPDASLETLPHLPLIHDGHHPALVMHLPEQQLLLRLWPTQITIDGDETPLWVGYVGHETLARLPLITIPGLGSDFDTPMLQFKPFVAMLNWQLKYRQPALETTPFWRGEVLVMWSDQVHQGNK